MTTNATTEPLTPAARAIIEALKQCGPLSRQELAQLLGESPGAIGTRVYLLAKDGLVVSGADDMVALPHQPLAPWLPDNERTHAQRRWQWQAHGLVTLRPDDVDGFAAQAIHAFAIKHYGRRQGLRPSRREDR